MNESKRKALKTLARKTENLAKEHNDLEL